MSKFKIGDLVEVSTQGAQRFLNGEQFVVTKVKKSSVQVGHFVLGDAGGYGVWESNLLLVKPAASASNVKESTDA